MASAMSVLPPLWLGLAPGVKAGHRLIREQWRGAEWLRRRGLRHR